MYSSPQTVADFHAVFGTRLPLSPEMVSANLFFNIAANMAAILKMAVDQSLIFRISTGFFFIQHLLNIGSELMKVSFFKMAAIFKMAADKILVVRISTGFFCIQHFLDVGSELINF